MNITIDVAREYVRMTTSVEADNFALFQQEALSLLDAAEEYERQSSSGMQNFYAAWNLRKARLVAIGLTLPDNVLKAAFLASAMSIETWRPAESVFMLRAAFETAVRMGDRT